MTSSWARGFIRRSARTALLGAILLACALASPRTAAAHPWSLTEARARFDSHGGYTLELLFDADALLFGVAPGHLAAQDSASLRALSLEERGRRVEELRVFFARTIEIRFDGELAAPVVWFPNLGETADGGAPGSGGEGLPGNKICFAGERPRGARAVSLLAPESFGTLLLSIQRDEGAPARRIVKPGIESESIALSDRGGASRLAIIALYARLGFEHILPKGLDHILFVVGLFLLSARTSALLKQVTAFTIAHSLTLALSMYGIVTLPPRIVEPSANALANPIMEQMRQGDGIIDMVNTYLGVALSSGLVGLGLFVGVFVCGSWRVVMVLRSKEASTPAIALAGRALLGCVFGVLIMIAMVSPIAAIPTLYWTLAGMTVGFGALIRNDKLAHESPAVSRQTSRPVGRRFSGGEAKPKESKV